jgi:hypothetical protein
VSYSATIIYTCAGVVLGDGTRSSATGVRDLAMGVWLSVTAWCWATESVFR